MAFHKLFADWHFLLSVYIMPVSCFAVFPYSPCSHLIGRSSRTIKEDNNLFADPSRDQVCAFH